MKRGLKGSGVTLEDLKLHGCKDYPDEKGTERQYMCDLLYKKSNDARITPMKRGLKG